MADVIEPAVPIVQLFDPTVMVNAFVDVHSLSSFLHHLSLTVAVPAVEVSTEKFAPLIPITEPVYAESFEFIMDIKELPLLQYGAPVL